MYKGNFKLAWKVKIIYYYLLIIICHGLQVLGDAITTAVENAIDIGYRSFDTAFAYDNEREIGIAIANKIAEGVVKREDLFVTSKVGIIQSDKLEKINLI